MQNKKTQARLKPTIHITFNTKEKVLVGIQLSVWIIVIAASMGAGAIVGMLLLTFVER
ncbi:hypothetical protein ACFL0L_02995 [Patescibacteria group bacterium]